MPRNGVRLDTDGRPLIVGNGLGVPEKVQAIVNRRYREIPTQNDGACGIHALVGKNCSGRLRHPDPRGFLRRTLGEAAGEVRLNCRNPKALDDAMNWAWKQVIKPQAQQHADLTDRNLGMLAEEEILWENVKENTVAFNACMRAVEQENDMLSLFKQKREAVAMSLRSLCENEMKEIFLRPLLVHMGISDDYDRPDHAGNRKIDVVGTDTMLGQHYRRGIVEYFGISNVDGFLMHVENTE